MRYQFGLTGLSVWFPYLVPRSQFSGWCRFLEGSGRFSLRFLVGWFWFPSPSASDNKERKHHRSTFQYRLTANGCEQRPHLGHGHSAVALIVPKLGLLIGCDGEGRVLEFRTGSSDGLSKDVLQLLVDVDHGSTARWRQTVETIVLETLWKTRTQWRPSQPGLGSDSSSGVAALTLFKMLTRYFSRVFSSRSSSSRGLGLRFSGFFRTRSSADRLWICCSWWRHTVIEPSTKAGQTGRKMFPKLEHSRTVSFRVTVDTTQTNNTFNS